MALGPRPTKFTYGGLPENGAPSERRYTHRSGCRVKRALSFLSRYQPPQSSIMVYPPCHRSEAFRGNYGRPKIAPYLHTATGLDVLNSALDAMDSFRAQAGRAGHVPPLALGGVQSLYTDRDSKLTSSHAGVPGLLFYLLDFIGNSITSAPVTRGQLSLRRIPTGALLLQRQLLSEDMPAYFVLGGHVHPSSLVLRQAVQGLTHRFLGEVKAYDDSGAHRIHAVSPDRAKAEVLHPLPQKLLSKRKRFACSVRSKKA